MRRKKSYWRDDSAIHNRAATGSTANVNASHETTDGKGRMARSEHGRSSMRNGPPGTRTAETLLRAVDQHRRGKQRQDDVRLRPRPQHQFVTHQQHAVHRDRQAVPARQFEPRRRANSHRFVEQELTRRAERHAVAGREDRARCLLSVHQHRLARFHHVSLTIAGDLGVKPRDIGEKRYVNRAHRPLPDRR